MSKILELFARERRLITQSRELRELRAEVGKLRTQTQRMREGMRRCVTCEYRIEVADRRAGGLAEPG